MFATETVYIQKCWALEIMIDYLTISRRKRHEYRRIVIVDYSRKYNYLLISYTAESASGKDKANPAF